MANQVEQIQKLVTAINQTAEHCEKFINIVEIRTDYVLDGMEHFDADLSRKISEKISVKELVKDSIKAANVFSNEVKLFFDNGSKSDFKAIKEEILTGESAKFNEFLSIMEKCLEKTRNAHNDLIEKCENASKQCTEVAEACSCEQAKARSKKIKTRFFGGTFSAALFGGGLVAAGAVVTVATGVFTLGTGAVAGVGLTAAGLTIAGTAATGTTAYVAYRYGDKVDTFRSLSSYFRDMATEGRNIKSSFDEIDVILIQCETNFDILQCTNNEYVTTLCRTLDQLKEILIKLDGKDVLDTFKAERFQRIIAS